MLVLTRKLNESLVIDGGIVVTVVSVENGRVRLGITAPRDISVRRSELQPLPVPSEREQGRELVAPGGRRPFR
jgi:carbon storage regulator